MKLVLEKKLKGLETRIKKLEDREVEILKIILGLSDVLDNYFRRMARL